MQRWARTNLQLEILEQFTDPAWFDFIVADAKFCGDLAVVNTNTDWGVVSRRADVDRLERILEVAATRPVWSVAALQAQLPPNILAQDIGTCLSGSKDWIQRGQTTVDRGNRRRWVNKKLLLDWLHEAGHIKLSDAAAQLDLQPRTLSRLMQETHAVVRGYIRRVI